ncbi:MAG: carboxylating nicotinate-nucleotide diphosphorylase [Bacteroidota bacterium]|nr:carboxylating nicotinate-nucleotide diphosphorylase [Bacteroidota bacterium]
MKVDFVSQDYFDKNISELVKFALKEDIGSGDHTSLSTIPDNSVIEAQLLIKDKGKIAGIDLAEYIFKYVDKNIELNKFFSDGDNAEYGDIAFKVKGKAQSILTSERLVLNFMQRLSGIATKSAYLTGLIKDYPTKLLDTRKTTPGLRFLEKWAVNIGGSYNHRIGLFDMILIKDNHVDYAGSITNAVNLANKYIEKNKLDIQIEVEIRNFDELNEILKLKNIVNRILLDNFTPENLEKAVKIVNKEIITEASGGITEKNIVDFAKTGVDYISSGALTNSVRSLDLSLKIIK